MKLKQAIGILETHNRWRRGEDVEPMLKPRDIGIAIDTVLAYVKNNGVLDDVIKCDCTFIEKEEGYSKMEIDSNYCLDCKKPIQ